MEFLGTELWLFSAALLNVPTRTLMTPLATTGSTISVFPWPWFRGGGKFLKFNTSEVKFHLIFFSEISWIINNVRKPRLGEYLRPEKVKTNRTSDQRTNMENMNEVIEAKKDSEIAGKHPKWELPWKNVVKNFYEK